MSTLAFENIDKMSAKHQVTVVLPTPPLKLMVAIVFGLLLPTIFNTPRPLFNLQYSANFAAETGC